MQRGLLNGAAPAPEANGEAAAPAKAEKPEKNETPKRGRQATAATE